MDLSENGKCLFTSLQYVESSHAPYQRIRFFYDVALRVDTAVISFIPDGKEGRLRNLTPQNIWILEKITSIGFFV
jgi:hypothetical protein